MPYFSDFDFTLLVIYIPVQQRCPMSMRANKEWREYGDPLIFLMQLLTLTYLYLVLSLVHESQDVDG